MRITTPDGAEYEVIGAHSVNGYPGRRLLRADLLIDGVTPPKPGMVFDCKLDTLQEQRDGVTLNIYGLRLSADGPMAFSALIEWQEAQP